MRLISMKIENFRSIQQASFESCGELNVLIGKNNSGKSNLLVAINRFFSFFTHQTASLSGLPFLSVETEAFQRRRESPSRIVATLEPSPEQHTVLRERISASAPQVRNALESIPADALLECELLFYQKPKRIAFISRLEFTIPSNAIQSPLGAREIFSMSAEAAAEIAERNREIRRLRDDYRKLPARILDSDDWRMLKDRERAARPSPRRLFATYELSPPTNDLLERVFQTSETLAEFNTSVRELSNSLVDQASRLTSEESRHHVNTFAGEARALPEYLDAFITMMAGCKVHYLKESREEIGESEARRILNLKTSRGQGDILRRIQGLVADLLGVRIDAFTADVPTHTSIKSEQAQAEIDVDDFLIQVNGSGIREALRIILDYEFEGPDVLLIEEPEVHLHPALEFAMLQYLKSIGNSCQVFLTTHSTNFLDTPEFQNVYLVTRESSTSVQLVHVEEAEEAIPQELGLRLSSMFMYERLVFVEGPTDERILRSLAATAGMNFGQISIGFIPIGGARNFGYYANSKVLSFLSKRRVEIHFLLDRDERTDADIEKLRERLGDFGRLWVFKRREIENYLLQAPAILRYLQKQGVKDASIDAIDSLIDSTCEQLQEIAVERIVLSQVFRPLIPDRDAIIERGEGEFAAAAIAELGRMKGDISALEASITELAEKARAELSDSWKQDRRGRVPGDLVLQKVFEHYNIRFAKRRDGLGIAEQMTREEISSEILDFLRALTTS
ncbi:AAA family ATPase [Nonomuraea sp. LP-02]|uniref:AAA family ATPase n=1 Tax=Nonomuraea sp. LP-02 TaxID=3097960 RepID=UPI002E32BEB4|nr:AAA family ATPase [Nonomuraea sp. LP-02]MED7926254.1 AAA family ATPase [Nonomuraea sp. LP-02]